jgi:hypothetical protein
MNEYSLGWFQEKAFSSLRKIKDGVWDFSDSLLIYVPNAEEKYEAIQEIDNPYYRLVTGPEKSYIDHIAGDIALALPDEFEYIDLGPGTEHKEQFIVEQLKKTGKKFKYVPVDIDKKYLSFAEQNAKSQGIPTRGIHSTFEELESKLDTSLPRFVSIGLTYTNYSPDKVLPLLNTIARPQGKIFIDAQIRERVDIAEVADIYQNEAYNLLEPKIQLLGLGRDDIAERWCDDKIQAWFSIKTPNQKLKDRGVKPGDKFLTYYFLRPTKESLATDISNYFKQYTVLDTGEDFVGALLSGT